MSTDERGALSGTEGILPSLSASARYVAFLAVSPGASGAPTTPNSGLRQVFVRDMCPGCDGLRTEGHANFPAAGLCCRGERETGRAGDCGIGETNCSGGRQERHDVHAHGCG